MILDGSKNKKRSKHNDFRLFLTPYYIFCDTHYLFNQNSYRMNVHYSNLFGDKCHNLKAEVNEE